MFAGRISGGATGSRFFIVSIAPPDSGPALDGDYYVQAEVARNSGFTEQLELNAAGYYYTQPQWVRVYKAKDRAAIALEARIGDPATRTSLTRAQFEGLDPAPRFAGGVRIERVDPDEDERCLD